MTRAEEAIEWVSCHEHSLVRFGSNLPMPCVVGRRQATEGGRRDVWPPNVGTGEASDRKVCRGAPSNGARPVAQSRTGHEAAGLQSLVVRPTRARQPGPELAGGGPEAMCQLLPYVRSRKAEIDTCRQG